MCSLLPADRPSLEESVVELQSMAQQQSPKQVLTDDAQRCLGDFRQAHDERVFGVTEKDLHLMSADVFMMQDPPECGRAIIELDAAEGSKYVADIQRRMARVYLQFTSHPDHVARSVEAYMRAAGLSDWAPDVLEEAMTALEASPDPSAALESTNIIPVKKRPRSILCLRARILYEMGNLMQAWKDVSQAMAGMPFDSSLYGLAEKIAEKIARDRDARDLMRWMHRLEDKSGCEAAMALVWSVNGNRAKAVELLEKLGQTDPSLRG